MNDNELRDKLAKEIILKESIICSHNEAIHDALESNAITGFKLGWDAARANPLQDEKRLWNENEELRQKLSMIEVKARRIGEKEEYQEIAEKLFYALDGLLFDTQHANHNCEDDGCPVAFAQTVLDEYKEKFLNKV